MLVKRILGIVLIVLVVAFSLFKEEKTFDYKEEDNYKEYVTTLKYHQNFNILQLTDIHWNTSTLVGDNATGSEGYLTKVINEAKSHVESKQQTLDLIEVTGDTFMLSTTRSVKSFIKFMESFGIPYAMEWGNHDREGKYNPNWLVEQFKNAEHCIYIEVDHDNVHERANYVINLVKESDPTYVEWQIFNIDSGASYRDGASDLGLDYDYIRQDQLDWMKYQHGKVASTTPSLAYYHIAQKDYDYIFNKIQDGATIKSKFFKLEGFAPSDNEETPLMHSTFEDCNVKGSFIGHCHAVDWTATYDNIVYGCGVKSGTELYYYDAKFDMGKDDKGLGFYGTANSTYQGEIQVIGASLVTLKKSRSNYYSSGEYFELEHLYLNEVDGGDDIIIWEAY